MDDESDATSTGNEWDGGDEDEPDDNIDDEDEDEDIDMSEDSIAEDEEDDPRQSLVVSLRYVKRGQSPASQDMRNGPVVSPVTTSNFKGPSETPHSTYSLEKSTQESTPTPYSRPTLQSTPLHQAPLTAPLSTVEYATSTAPKPQVGHSSRGTPVALSEKDHNQFHQDYPQREEKSTPSVSWPSSETGLLASNGTQM